MQGQTQHQTMPQRRGSLEGIRVVDITRALAGPYCTSLLGDLGAEVIKVETSMKGERARQLQPAAGGQSLYCIAVNRNKKGIVLNLRDPKGLDVLADLIARADVLVENFRPGVLESMGLGWDTLSRRNPRLVLARISGFGQDGPYAQRRGLDMAAQAMSGIMHLTGVADGPPTMAGVFMCDYTTGIYAALGVLAALFAREQTGRGQVVEASLLDSALPMLNSAIPDMLLNGVAAGRIGNRDRYTAPTNTFRTADNEWVMLLAGRDEMFPRLARLIGRPDLIDHPDFRSFRERVSHVEESERLAADWIGARTVDEVVDAMAEAGIPCAKCATIEDVVSNPQLKARDQIPVVRQPTGAEVPVAGLAIRLSDTPLSIRSGLPNVGQHTEDVLRAWLDYDDDRLAALRAAQAIGQAAAPPGQLAAGGKA